MPFTALGRVEWIADIPIPVVNQLYRLSAGTGLPTDRFLEGLIIRYQGRLTNVGATGAALADAPFSLIDSIVVRGYHRWRKATEEFINLRGSELRTLHAIYTGHLPQAIPAVIAVGAAGVSDIDMVIYVPFTPLQIRLHEKVYWLLDAPNYDSLTVEIRVADAFSVMLAATGAFTAFGLAAGNPQIRVSGVFAQGGVDRFAGLVPGRVWRYNRTTNVGNIIAGGANLRLFEIPRGHKIRGLMVKTGLPSVTTAAGNFAFQGLLDAVIANPRIMRGQGRQIRHYLDFVDAREEVGHAYGVGVAPPMGYALIDFARHGTMGEALKTEDLIAGPSGDTDLFLQGDVVPAAVQAAVMIIEELRNPAVMATVRRG